MKRLAIISTHPIQYNAPWFRLLAERNKCSIKVFYTWSQSKESVKDRTFGKEIEWDIPLLEGYDYEFIENVSKKPGTYHFFGIDCPSLIAKIESFNSDAILFFGWNFKTHLMAMRYFKGKIPVWFRGDSTLLDEVGGYKTKLRRLALKYVYSFVDKAFYVGYANKEYFLKHGLTSVQLIYAPHAIDNLRFKGDSGADYETRSLRWREELGFKKDDIVVVFAGKFEAKKQPDVLIKAVNNANEFRTSPIKLLMVGNGPLEHHLMKLADCDKNIQFLPFQNQTLMPLVYRLGNVFCLPSRGPGETWGLAVNEAMASGKPVIVSTKVGCAKDLVKSSENGYVFKGNDIEALEQILKNLTIKELDKLAHNAKSTVEIYNFEAIVEPIEHELAII